ncbi:ribonuclease III [Acetanaerobacterium elongatum]|uniref:Ribonuclease 3 n=1 Tax=Acetanaerobacterium elongatum TaxID=258515 RepID=A0A1H0DLP3_9FIRM|nr:ribonuclease III [Acetanaerobacterium elongatum]SDN70911.1 ribonuclease-3 [Acetanaerobacterium elongatum]
MEKLGYRFKDPALLKTALTHSSYANETKKGTICNERLEFLGDSVLSIVVSEYLFTHYKHLPEGELTKLRASLVCERMLWEFAKQIDLGSYILLGRGEDLSGGRERPSILSDAFEAVIAAIYLDGGIEPVTQYILGFVKKQLEGKNQTPFKDYKTMLQEIIQQNREESVSYYLVDESGPDHDKRFTVEVHLNSNVIGTGIGRSKKDAEQQAAREALELMGK